MFYTLVKKLNQNVGKLESRIISARLYTIIYIMHLQTIILLYEKIMYTKKLNLMNLNLKSSY